MPHYACRLSRKIAGEKFQLHLLENRLQLDVVATLFYTRPLSHSRTQERWITVTRSFRIVDAEKHFRTLEISEDFVKCPRY